MQQDNSDSEETVHKEEEVAEVLTGVVLDDDAYEGAYICRTHAHTQVHARAHSHMREYASNTIVRGI